MGSDVIEKNRDHVRLYDLMYRRSMMMMSSIFFVAYEFDGLTLDFTLYLMSPAVALLGRTLNLF